MQIHLKRERAPDLLRGIAVFLMICAHALAFFYTGANPILGGLRTFGDTVAFVMFVFVAGATTYFAYLDTPNVYEHHVKPSRVVKLLQCYYLVAFISAIEDFLKLTLDQWPMLAAKILLFIQLPDYSEFLLTFVLFTVIVAFTQGELKFFADSKYKIIGPAIIAYLLGYLVYHHVENYPLAYFTSLFAGHLDWYRFPVLQYMPVFLIGIYVGKLIDKDNFSPNRRILLVIFALIAVVFAIASFYVPNLSSFPYLVEFGRWPPSLGFLSIGLATSLIFTWILSSKIPLTNPVEATLSTMGKHALGYYMFHMILYELLDLVFPNFATSNSLILVLIVILTIFSCHFILQHNKEEKGASEFKGGLKKEEKRGIITIGLLSKNTKKKMTNKLRNLAIVTLVVSLILLLVFWVYRCNITQRFGCGGVATQVNTGNVAGQVLGQIAQVNPKIAEEKEIWWNGEYAYAQNISLTNTSVVETLATDSTVKVDFNHQNIVNQSKTLSEGEDLHLVYFQDGEYIEVPFELNNANTANASLEFNLVNDISSLKADDSYCLYYGNSYAEATDRANIVSSPTSISYTAELDEVRVNPVQSKTNRKWILRGSKEYSDLILTLKLNNNEVEAESAMYQIVGEDKEGELSQVAENEFALSIDTSTLKPGTYQIKSYLTSSNGVVFDSPTQEFILSYPLYVAWSIDWEGMDTSDGTLKAMEDFSNRHQLPLIQLWNPRAHLVLNPVRLSKLITWIKAREAKGDQIGLHTHMFNDMVAAAGVVPNTTSPNWAAERNHSGSDTPAYVYSEDEHVKMLNWSKEQFTKYGLKTPTVYRAGGWMADLNLVKALDSTGFTIDTSGRTAYALGEYKIIVTDENNASQIRRATSEEIEFYLTNKDNLASNGSLPRFIEHRVEGVWDLEATTRPYQISSTDINTTGIPNLSIWEFPNNGAESWRFNTLDLMERFDLNFNGQPLADTQVLTYLSHPHAIQIDIKKLEPTFNHIDQYTAKADQGPVIYSTFEEPYQYLTSKNSQ